MKHLIIILAALASFNAAAADINDIARDCAHRSVSAIVDQVNREKHTNISPDHPKLAATMNDFKNLCAMSYQQGQNARSITTVKITRDIAFKSMYASIKASSGADMPDQLTAEIANIIADTLMNGYEGE